MYYTTEARHRVSFWRTYIFSTDHKVIGLQYILTGLFMALLGGFLAYAFRMQLAYPNQEIPLFGAMGPDLYNAAVTMHGTIMLFWVAQPILVSGFGNYLLPLQLGAEDMCFPRLNMLSFWVFFISTVILIASFFVPGGAMAGGWTAYPPLNARMITPASIGAAASGSWRWPWNSPQP